MMYVLLDEYSIGKQTQQTQNKDYTTNLLQMAYMDFATESPYDEHMVTDAAITVVELQSKLPYRTVCFQRSMFRSQKLWFVWYGSIVRDHLCKRQLREI